MNLLEAALPTFALHEIFHLRYGWFRKAHEVAAEDLAVFAAEDAPSVWASAQTWWERSTTGGRLGK